MKQILFFLFPALFAITACSSTRKLSSSMITQGITGIITEQTGNQMPMKGAPRPNPKGILTTVFVYEPTNLKQVKQDGTSPVYTEISTKMIASAQTDSTGHFTIALPAGSYSVFVKLGSAFYANMFDASNNIALFAVEEGKLTTVNLKVSNNATY